MQIKFHSNTRFKKPKASVQRNAYLDDETSYIQSYSGSDNEYDDCVTDSNGTYQYGPSYFSALLQDEVTIGTFVTENTMSTYRSNFSEFTDCSEQTGASDYTDTSDYSSFADSKQTGVSDLTSFCKSTAMSSKVGESALKAELTRRIAKEMRSLSIEDLKFLMKNGTMVKHTRRPGLETLAEEDSRNGDDYNSMEEKLYNAGKEIRLENDSEEYSESSIIGSSTVEDDGTERSFEDSYGSAFESSSYSSDQEDGLKSNSQEYSDSSADYSEDDLSQRNSVDELECEHSQSYDSDNLSSHQNETKGFFSFCLFRRNNQNSNVQKDKCVPKPSITQKSNIQVISDDDSVDVITRNGLDRYSTSFKMGKSGTSFDLKESDVTAVQQSLISDGLRKSSLSELNDDLQRKTCDNILPGIYVEKDKSSVHIDEKIDFSFSYNSSSTPGSLVSNMHHPNNHFVSNDRVSKPVIFKPATILLADQTHASEKEKSDQNHLSFPYKKFINNINSSESDKLHDIELQSFMTNNVNQKYDRKRSKYMHDSIEDESRGAVEAFRMDHIGILNTKSRDEQVSKLVQTHASEHGKPNESKTKFTNELEEDASFKSVGRGSVHDVALKSFMTNNVNQQYYIERSGDTPEAIEDQSRDLVESFRMDHIGILSTNSQDAQFSKLVMTKPSTILLVDQAHVGDEEISDESNITFTNELEEYVCIDGNERNKLNNFHQHDMEQSGDVPEAIEDESRDLVEAFRMNNSDDGISYEKDDASWCSYDEECIDTARDEILSIEQIIMPAREIGFVQELSIKSEEKVVELQLSGDVDDAKSFESNSNKELDAASLESSTDLIGVKKLLNNYFIEEPVNEHRFDIHPDLIGLNSYNGDKENDYQLLFEACHTTSQYNIQEDEEDILGINHLIQLVKGTQSEQAHAKDNASILQGFTGL